MTKLDKTADKLRLSGETVYNAGTIYGITKWQELPPEKRRAWRAVAKYAIKKGMKP